MLSGHSWFSRRLAVRTLVNGELHPSKPGRRSRTGRSSLARSQVRGVSPVASANCHVSVYCWNFAILPSAMSHT